MTTLSEVSAWSYLFLVLILPLMWEHLPRNCVEYGCTGSRLNSLRYLQEDVYEQSVA